MKPLADTQLPLTEPLVGQGGRVSDGWREYLSRLPVSLGAIPSIYNRISLTAQGASIAATDLSGGTLPTGTYRVSWYARITRAATTSSSLTVRINWVDGGVSCNSSGAAVTGNTTATTQGTSIVIRHDTGSALTYQTTYASVGGTSMQYRLTLVLEQLDRLA